VRHSVTGHLVVTGAPLRFVCGSTSGALDVGVTSSMGAREDIPVAVGPIGQLQDLVPFGEALEFFDALSVKAILERL
jgi:hypothetical protein